MRCVQTTFYCKTKQNDDLLAQADDVESCNESWDSCFWSSRVRVLLVSMDSENSYQCSFFHYHKPNSVVDYCPGMKASVGLGPD